MRDNFKVLNLGNCKDNDTMTKIRKLRGKTDLWVSHLEKCWVLINVLYSDEISQQAIIENSVLEKLLLDWC